MWVGMTRGVVTHGSLFTGIGGFDLGFERAGIKTLWQVENDKYANKVLTKHWPEVKRYGDIREVRSPERVDIISGGFPCQPFSVAGKQRGKQDDRYLWPEMLRVIAQVKPRWVVAENVAGIIRLSLDKVLSDLEAEGYSVGAVVLPAAAFDAPHRGDRVWIIAHTTDSRTKNMRKGENEVLANSGRKLRKGSIKQEANEDEAGKRDANKYKRSSGSSKPDVADTSAQGLQRGKRGSSERSRPSSQSRWPVEPDVGRVAHGIPSRVDRLKCLGNAIVPQIAEHIGRMMRSVND